MDHQADIRIKTCLLKKYEAAPHVCATEGDDGSPAMDFYSPFGPLLSRVRVSPSLVERVNHYSDRFLSPGRSEEFMLEEQFVRDGGDESLAHQTGQMIARYLRQVENAVVNEVRFEVFWIVSQYASTPSPVHFHSGDVSGVLYLKVPEIADEEREESRTYISGRQAGYINFLIGGKQKYSKSLISFKPEVGDFYIFPGWLLHGAEPFRGTGERRSMAFNAYVT